MAEAAAAVIAGLALGYGVYSGERQNDMARQGVRRQEEQQRKAEAAALAEQARADQEQNRARKKSPDLGVLLNDVAAGFRPSQQSVRSDQLLLGRPGLLGA